ncbi:MAG: GatB/YqeY domain-containing protein [Alistipes sp.]|nr:GatB/YqeY domain-containing protein [Alistipes sp.]
MELEKQVSDGIMAAMKAKDDVRRDTLRNVKKLIIEAKTAGPNMDTLPDEAVIKIINKLDKQGADSAAVFREQGRDDLYAYEMAQVAVLKEFLPEQLEDDALEKEVAAIIAETGAAGMKDMGKVMGAASKKLAGRADGKAISEIVKKLLC